MLRGLFRRQLAEAAVGAPAAWQRSVGAPPLLASADAEDGTLPVLQEVLRELDAHLLRLGALRAELRSRYGSLLPRFADRLLSEADQTALSADRLSRMAQDLAGRREGR